MIAIRLALQAGGVPATPLIAVFDESGGDIGRAADCTLVLPDPERRISRKHLQVTWRDGRYWLRLMSANLLVELDGAPMVPGVESELQVGAHVGIGPFALLVENGDAAAAKVPQTAAPAGTSTSTSTSDDASALWAAHESAPKPSVFSDLLSQAPVERRARPRLPFDSSSDPIDLVLGGATDLDAQLAAGAAFDAPGAQAMVEALYRGLGIAAPPPSVRTPGQVGLVGALLRASIGGALRLLAARGIAKHELGADTTQIQTRQNNPLKFSADVDAALTRLLEPPQRGFIAALPAVEQTFDDLQAHEVAMLAGMRAALEQVLERFDPVALERSLVDKGVWENLLPANHKARLWERFAEQHAQALREIEGSFDALFAGAFSRAYDEQLKRLRKS